MKTNIILLFLILLSPVSFAFEEYEVMNAKVVSQTNHLRVLLERGSVDGIKPYDYVMILDENNFVARAIASYVGLTTSLWALHRIDRPSLLTNQKILSIRKMPIRTMPEFARLRAELLEERLMDIKDLDEDSH